MLRSSRPRRLLATVVFTDIVGSTALAEQLGDARWRRLLADHHQLIRRLLRRHRGREVDTAGDGFFATFSQPADAIACAIEAADAVARLDIQIRAGIHTGEVELMGAKVGGIGVHIGARILGVAEPGQLLVSSTVHDLVTGGEFTFSDAGTRILKGVAGEWRLWSVVRPSREPEPSTAPEPGGTSARNVVWPLWAAALALLAATSGAAAFAMFARSDPPVGANQLRGIRLDGTLAEGHTVGSGPSAVALSGETAWVVNTFGGTLSRVGLTDGQDAVVGIGIPTDLAIDGDLVWVLDPFAGVVTVVSTNEARVVQSVDVQGRAIDASDSGIWLADDISDAVHRVNPRTGAIEATIELPPGSGPMAIAATAEAVWVVNQLSGTVSRIDPATNEVTVEALALSSRPSAVDAVGSAVWIASEEDDVIIALDPATDRVIRQEATCDRPSDIVVAGSDVVVACAGDRAIWRHRGGGGDPLITELDGVPTGIAADGDEVWVTIRPG